MRMANILRFESGRWHLQIHLSSINLSIGVSCCKFIAEHHLFNIHHFCTLFGYCQCLSWYYTFFVYLRLIVQIFYGTGYLLIPLFAYLLPIHALIFHEYVRIVHTCVISNDLLNQIGFFKWMNQFMHCVMVKWAVSCLIFRSQRIDK